MTVRRRSESMLITHVGASIRARRPDELIVEEPMTIQLDGVKVATTMRTPGHDFDLAAGFLFGDGMLGGAAIRSVRYCGTGSATDTEFNVVTVETDGSAPPPTPRLGTTTSSCGLCGSDTIDELAARLTTLTPSVPFSLELLALVPARVRPHQTLFEATGGVHAAAAFDADGNVLLVREDVGRHNAVDKVVGRMLLDGGLPASGIGLFVSGRASFELVQKAWAAGFSTLLSVSAPTALAATTAQRAGLMLAGFLRNDEFNVYAPERLSNDMRWRAE